MQSIDTRKFVRAASLAAAGILALAAGAIGQNAPARPACSAATPCEWNPTNGVGAGVRVVLSDATGGHGQSKTYLFNSLTRLATRYGFTLTRIANLNDITDPYLANAKVIIFSNGDGDLGGSIPNATVRTRVEDFVLTRGWGLMMVHAACAFIDTWPFQQDACIQQYFHHNGSGTAADVVVENKTVNGVAHGRASPYASFFLAGLPDRVRMSDEWYTWRGAPISTHQYNRASVNKIMLLRLDEATYASVTPTYGADHHVAWTQTQGAGITIYNSVGHDDTYQQDGTRRAFGDTLLWRQIRYLAKDFRVAPTKIFSAESKLGNGISLEAGSLALSFHDAAGNAVTVTDISGKQVYTKTYSGVRDAEIPGLKRGLYFVKVASAKGTEVRKVSLY